MVTEHAPDRTRGKVVTTEYGPAFFNQPRGEARNGFAPLLLGGGADRPMRNPSSRRRSPAIHSQLLRLRDMFYPELQGQPSSSEWVGPMAFTPDQLPVIGFLRPGIVIAAGYNGYGGSYTTAAGQAAAVMALTRQVPEWVPEDVFSPRRLLCDSPLFVQRHDGLWRIAAALCHRLRAVNQEIAGNLHDAPANGTGEPLRTLARSRIRRASRASITPGVLKAFPTFRRFTLNELRELLKLMRSWHAPKGSVVCAEGSPGGSCFVIVRGAIEVSIQVRGEQQMIARLPPSHIFGQVSLIDHKRRSATCTAHTDTLLAEMARENCIRLFRGESQTALKFLGALNDGLISALRAADRRLLQWNGAQSEANLRVPAAPQLRNAPFEAGFIPG